MQQTMKTCWVVGTRTVVPPTPDCPYQRTRVVPTGCALTREAALELAKQSIGTNGTLEVYPNETVVIEDGVYYHIRARYYNTSSRNTRTVYTCKEACENDGEVTLVIGDAVFKLISIYVIYPVDS